MLSERWRVAANPTQFNLSEFLSRVCASPYVIYESGLGNVVGNWQKTFFEMLLRREFGR